MLTLDNSKIFYEESKLTTKISFFWNMILQYQGKKYMKCYFDNFSETCYVFLLQYFSIKHQFEEF